MDDTPQPHDSAGGCILHLFWTLVGPSFLLVLGLPCFRAPGGCEALGAGTGE